MIRRLWPARVALLLALLVSAAGQTRDTLPSSLADREFWALTQQLSEPDGYFRSNSGSPDNLLSNETQFANVATQLGTRVKPNGVYLGVGPEQNFTYIATMRPRIAFITDIRRGNLNLHLLYKAAFEMTANRADFVALLFARKRPEGLTPRSSARELMNAYLRAEAVDESTFKANLKALSEHLTKTRSFPLAMDDLTGIEYVYRNFYRFGLAIHYPSSINGTTGTPYAQIMGTTDSAGMEKSYLANEDNFTFVKGMEEKNLVVPIVGDFAGPKALRAVGKYVRDRGAIVSAFYVSNVEMYLQGNGVWSAFCANVATLPLDATSVFIRPSGGRGASPFGPMFSETASCKGR
jgi:hypothetical protein